MLTVFCCYTLLKLIWQLKYVKIANVSGVELIDIFDHLPLLKLCLKSICIPTYDYSSIHVSSFESKVTVMCTLNILFKYFEAFKKREKLQLDVENPVLQTMNRIYVGYYVMDAKHCTQWKVWNNNWTVLHSVQKKQVRQIYSIYKSTA